MMKYRTTRPVYGSQGRIIQADEVVSIDQLRELVTADQLAQLESSGAIVKDHQGGSFEVGTMSPSQVEKIIAGSKDMKQLRAIADNERERIAALTSPAARAARSGVLSQVDRRIEQLEKGDAG